jgi:hypothetical protein
MFKGDKKMSFGRSKFWKNCEHKNKVNIGTFKKPNIRCLRCDKKITEKLYLYKDMKKFEVRRRAY